MKNSLSDLNNHLFAQLERLSNEDLTEFDLEEEIKRARVVSLVGETIINNAKLIYETSKSLENKELNKDKIPDVLRVEK